MIVCFDAGETGFPEPQFKNRLCATNHLNGGILPHNPDSCKDATSDGLINLSVCNDDCIKNRCKDEPLCQGYGFDNNGNVRLVSSITGVGSGDHWKTVRKTTCQGKIRCIISYLPH